VGVNLCILLQKLNAVDAGQSRERWFRNPTKVHDVGQKPVLVLNVSALASREPLQGVTVRATLQVYEDAHPLGAARGNHCRGSVGSPRRWTGRLDGKHPNSHDEQKDR
jgi:hypothetical protein